MPHVPAHNPNSLIKRPSQELLSQTYGGGSFQAPPTLSAKVVPNATGLVNDPSQQPSETPGAPTSQVRGSPLDQRQNERQGNGEADRRATRDVSPANPARAVDTAGQWDGLGMGNMISAAMPGGSIAKGFAKAMQGLFGTHAVVGAEDVRMGDPGWDQKQATIRQTSIRNMTQRAREASGGRAAVGSSRDISSGPSKGRGGISDPNLGKSAANRDRGGRGAEGGSGGGGNRGPGHGAGQGSGRGDFGGPR